MGPGARRHTTCGGVDSRSCTRMGNDDSVLCDRSSLLIAWSIMKRQSESWRALAQCEQG